MAFHRVERRPEALAHVLVGWIRELVDPANDVPVPRETCREHIVLVDMGRKRSRALDLNPVVKLLADDAAVGQELR